MNFKRHLFGLAAALSLAAPAQAGTTVVFLDSASTSPWTVPVGVTQLDSIEAIGGGSGGSGGGVASGNCTAGGGGAYNVVGPQTVTPGANLAFTVGLGGAGGSATGLGGAGGDTWFGNAAEASALVAAKGAAAPTSSTPGAGGVAASGIGSGTSGAAGGKCLGYGGGAGGGAGGPYDPGQAGGNSAGGVKGGGGGGSANGGGAPSAGSGNSGANGGVSRYNIVGVKTVGGAGSSSTATPGGTGAQGSGGGGGAGNSTSGGATSAGGAGSTDPAWGDATHGPGSGGGGGGANLGTTNNSGGGAGGTCGGGGGAGGYDGGAAATGGNGGNGCIRIAYNTGGAAANPLGEYVLSVLDEPEVQPASAALFGFTAKTIASGTDAAYSVFQPASLAAIDSIYYNCTAQGTSGAVTITGGIYALSSGAPTGAALATTAAVTPSCPATAFVNLTSAFTPTATQLQNGLAIEWQYTSGAGTNLSVTLATTPRWIDPSEASLLPYASLDNGGGAGALPAYGYRTSSCTFGFPFVTAAPTKNATSTQEVLTELTVPSGFASITIQGVRVFAQIDTNDPDILWASAYNSAGTSVLASGPSDSVRWNPGNGLVNDIEIYFSSPLTVAGGATVYLGVASDISSRNLTIYGVDVTASGDQCALPWGTAIAGAVRTLNTPPTAAAGPLSPSADGSSFTASATARWLIEPIVGGAGWTVSP